MGRLLDDKDTVGIYMRMDKALWKRFRVAAVRNDCSAAKMIRILVKEFVKKSGE